MSSSHLAIGAVFIYLLGLGACSTALPPGDGGGEGDVGDSGGIRIVSVGEFADRTEGTKVTGDSVRAGFASALEKRGMLAGEGSESYRISGDILDIETSQWLRPHASVRLRVRVTSRRGDLAVHSGVYEGKCQIDGIPMWSPSAIGKAETAVEIALGKAIESAFDDSKFRRVLVY